MQTKKLVNRINVKVAISLAFLIFFGTCNLKRNQDISFLADASSLKIPRSVTDINYQYIRSDEYIYPYSFYAKFKCDSEAYRSIQKQISPKSKIERNSSNIILNSHVLATSKVFLNANKVEWWDVKNKVAPDKIVINYFGDKGLKRIGDTTSFNGKIAVFFAAPYCYLFIECFPPDSVIK